MAITVSIMQLASVRKIIAEAEAKIADETMTTVMLTLFDKSEKADPITPEYICDYVCVLLGVNKHDIISASRRAYLVDARRLVALLARSYTTYTYREIGEALGNRDHTTILALLNTAGSLLEARDIVFTQKYELVAEAFIQHLKQIKQKTDEQEHTIESNPNKAIESGANVCNKIPCTQVSPSIPAK